MELTPGESTCDTVRAQVREGSEAVVAGGGTAGVVAAIAAARTGVKSRRRCSTRVEIDVACQIV